MFDPPRNLTLNGPDETARLAARIGPGLRAGDCLLLAGPIGAGKTHFARHLIQSVLRQPEDVPSPTFTLVQVYDTRAGELWHADLYRLNSASEIEELGLADAFEQAVCLVEWPEKLGPLAPPNALRVRFSSDPLRDDTRHVELDWSDPKWSRLMGECLEHG